MKNLVGCNFAALAFHGKYDAIDFRNADFTDANCVGTSFRHCNFFGAKLIRTNLTHADLSFSDIRRADFTGADLTGANFYKCTIDMIPRIYGLTIKLRNYPRCPDALILEWAGPAGRRFADRVGNAAAIPLIKYASS
jgi:hypothetical protein